MYFPLVPRAPKKTKILISLFHTPTDKGRLMFYCVLRAGHLIAGQDYKKVHPNYPGHKLLLCLRGEGMVEVNGRVWPVGPNQIAWINNDHENKHWPAENSPWEMLWIRVDGPHMDQIYQTLTSAGSPVIGGINVRSTSAVFRRIIKIMQKRPIAMEATMHAEIAALIRELFTARHSANPQPGEKAEIPKSLIKPMEAIRLYFARPLRVADLAKLANMSVSNFFRHFKAATGTSPIDWLKRERVNQAKKRLLETDDSIGKIADETGYYDQFYFSRDFKRMNGVSPSHYRERERAHRKKILRQM